VLALRVCLQEVNASVSEKPTLPGKMVLTRRSSVSEPNVLCPRSLGTLSHLVLNGLADAETLDRAFLQRGMVEEDVASFSLDKAKTSVRNQLLNRTLRHSCHSLTTKPEHT
jgi:hypothetical protein